MCARSHRLILRCSTKVLLRFWARQCNDIVAECRYNIGDFPLRVCVHTIKAVRLAITVCVIEGLERDALEKIGLEDWTFVDMFLISM